MSDLVEFLTSDFSFADERGWLHQLCREGWTQVNVSKTVQGVQRGGHYHKQTREAFFIIDGEIQLHLQNGEKTEEITVKSGDFFFFPPYVKHSFTFVKDTVMVALYDKGVEMADGTKDIFSE